MKRRNMAIGANTKHASNFCAQLFLSARLEQTETASGAHGHHSNPFKNNNKVHWPPTYLATISVASWHSIIGAVWPCFTCWFHWMRGLGYPYCIEKREMRSTADIGGRVKRVGSRRFRRVAARRSCPRRGPVTAHRRVSGRGERCRPFRPRKCVGFSACQTTDRSMTVPGSGGWTRPSAGVRWTSAKRRTCAAAPPDSGGVSSSAVSPDAGSRWLGPPGHSSASGRRESPAVRGTRCNVNKSDAQSKHVKCTPPTDGSPLTAKIGTPPSP